ncbi:MAG: HD domain-containing phosphohydrolase [Holophagae bacterium]|jgi:HD-GYP domain-containing protein (c-di-GMP phosphodiesterase class II)
MANPQHAPDSPGAGRRRFPLYVTLAAVFVTLFVVFGLALILFFHAEGRRIELLGANDLMDRIGSHMEVSIAELYQPAQGLVDISSKAVPVAGSTLEERLLSLGSLAEALRLNPQLSSIFVGYRDGDFFLVRSVADRRVAAETLDAPSDSRFAVQSIERGAGGDPRALLLFFDDDLKMMDTRELPTAGFDPRERDWYSAAIAHDEPVTTDFYVFFTTGEVGITFARRLASGDGVVGADLALADLSAGLARQRVTPSTKIALFDASNRVIALSTAEMRVAEAGRGSTNRVTMPRLSELDDPAYGALASILGSGSRVGRHQLDVAGERWMASVSAVPTRRGRPIFLATIIPSAELLADIDRVRNQSVLIAVALLLIAAGIVLAVSRGLSSSLRALAREAEQIRRFKLGRPLEVRSRIAEVDELAGTMSVMKGSLQRFFEISHALSAEKDYRKLLEMILRGARKVAHADGGAILMTNVDETGLEVAVAEDAHTGVHVGGTSGNDSRVAPVRFDDGTSVDSETARLGTTVWVQDVLSDSSFDATPIRERYGWRDDASPRSLINVPLKDQKDEIVGVLQLVNARTPTGDVTAFDPEVVPFVEALSADAAVALDLRRMLQAQKDLLDAIIHMVAGAIDAKSPYTHGHCQRVPEIAVMLAGAAHEASDGPFAAFRLSAEEWYELEVASWLHDCGKLTTPEYVVDKATRLETIHNRLHEIRTRFEVLWRDAEIEYLRELSAGNPENAEAKDRLEKRLDQIRRDYRFIAECNSGETFMDEERARRVRTIGEQRWTRHFDDRIGLSHEELERFSGRAADALPVEEPLLADRPEHLVTRKSDPFGANDLGFRMEVPEHLYNHGEIYNLCTPRGTLSTEERFKINEHILESIRMLDRLPFPKELRRVPEWAGNHHEKLDGTGYPRRLSAADLSVPARIMAVADIFEALTASDRPYKPPKTLSQAIGIMASMRDDGHLCPELFELFLTTGVYKKYGEQHLKREQLDEVDIGEFVVR